MSDSIETTGNEIDNETEAMLTDREARVLGSLMEKQMTTPDQYPLTLNALVTACNQKSSRSPVMNLTPSEVGGTINSLRGRGLVTASLAARADRYEQHLSRALKLQSKERALIAVLLLRGAQTLNELRVHTNRMAEFASNDEVESVLTGLAGRDEPLAIRLPRAPGQREERYMHLLCGMPDVSSAAGAMAAEAPAEGASSPGLGGRVAELERQVAELRQEIDRLKNPAGE